MTRIAHWPTAPGALARPDTRHLSPGHQTRRPAPEHLDAFCERLPRQGRFAGIAEAAANRGLASVLLVLSLPLLAVVALAILLTDGRPVLYCGVRMGRGRRPFRMYKFRTLVCGAHRLIGGRLMTHTDDMTISIGWFLRDTRLDELPQLLNILLGHMNFIGPRPERPEVYEFLCREIPGYERRFAVKPGLIGYSQLFTPHNAPKRCRTLIDNWMVRKKPHPLADIFLIAYTGVIVLRSAALRLARFARQDVLTSRILGRYREKREVARIRPRGGHAFVGLNGHRARAELVDISDSDFMLRLRQELEQPYPQRFELRIPVGGSNGHTRIRRALCDGRVRQVRSAGDGFEYVVSYRPARPSSHYMLHQHFLRRSLARPPLRRRN